MKVLFLLLIVSIVCSCGSSATVYYPKPKGYERIDLPLHKYQTLEGSYPFTFEYSQSAIIKPDKSKDAEPNWILVEYPNLNAKVQFTYKPLLGDLRKLDEHVSDAYKLAAKHQVRAISQTEQVIKLRNGKSVVVIELEGEVPSHYQFYATDTSRHFLRGAVYLNSATFGDSLRPIVDFLKIDSRHILETLKWKN
jgi:gliding motility-associated lipoprotein GldD